MCGAGSTTGLSSGKRRKVVHCELPVVRYELQDHLVVWRELQEVRRELQQLLTSTPIS